MNVDSKALSYIIHNKELFPFKHLKPDYQVIQDFIIKKHQDTGNVPSPAIIKLSLKEPKFIAILNSISAVEELPEDIQEQLNIRYLNDAYIDILEQATELLEKKEFDKIRKLFKDASFDLDSDDVIRCVDFESEIEEFVTLGLDTSYRELNTTGKASLVAISAFTSVGKSLLAIQMSANKFLNDNENILYISYEMSKAQIEARMLASMSDVPMVNIQEKNYPLKELELRVKAVKQAVKYKITTQAAINAVLNGEDLSKKGLEPRENKMYILAMPDAKEVMEAKKSGRKLQDLPDADELPHKIEYYCKKYNVGYVVIDHIFEVQYNDKLAEHTAYGRLARALRRTALYNNATIVMLAQADEGNPLYIKYSTAIKQVLDKQISIVQTKEMQEFNAVGLALGKNRGLPGAGNIYIFSAQKDKQKFVEIEGEPVLKIHNVKFK